MSQGTQNREHAADYTAPVNATAADIASTEDKTPGCTIVIANTPHPYDKAKRLVFVRGSWVDGEYAPFPAGFQGTREAPGPLMLVRPGGGAYGKFAGHYRLGWVFECSHAAVETLVPWLDQAKAKFEATLPQTHKPAKVGAPTKAKQVLPTL
jgi:hypothetical protein